MHNYHYHMDKYEFRRQRLLRLRDERCNGKISDVARAIGREPSYVSRMLYTEGKSGKKRIADNMVEIIENSFSLPRGWMDGIVDADTSSTQDTQDLTPKQKILLELFGELPDSEADDLLKTLEEKKRKYDELYAELEKKKRRKIAS